MLDVLDIGVALIDRDVREWQANNLTYWQTNEVEMSVDDALREIDLRLRKAGTIYRVESGIIIKSTDDYSHTAMIVPALRVLGVQGFENAQSEFHKALEAYRNAIYGDVLHEANKAFESTMKIIAGQMDWPYTETAKAKDMITVMKKNALFPVMLESSVNALITLLESTVPTLRNKSPSSGHGAGENPPFTDESIAAFGLNIAAANIRMLVELANKKISSCQ